MNTLSPLITVHNKGYINVDTNKQTMSLIPVKIIEVETNNPHLPLISQGYIMFNRKLRTQNSSINNSKKHERERSG